MTMSLSTARLDRLVLVRLRTTSPPTRTELVEFARRYRPSLSGDDVAAALGRLQQDGLVSGRAVTAHGEDGLRGLGGAGSPWKRIADFALPAFALGWSSDDPRVRSRLKDREAWAAAIVARDYGLIASGSPPPTPPQVANAIVWRRLGLSGKLPQQVPAAIATLFIGHLLETEVAGWQSGLVQLAAKSVRAPRADLKALRQGVIGEWLADRSWTDASREVAAEPRLAAPPPGPDAPPRPDDLEGFARRVRDAARQARSGVFGDHKVFISALWRDLGAGRETAASLDDFKQRLVEASRRGLLRLHRADLVEEMDPAEVNASATRSMDATFHFVEREATR